MNYGERIWEIHVPEALSVNHISDSGPRQVIFDLEEIIKVVEVTESNTSKK